MPPREKKFRIRIYKDIALKGENGIMGNNELATVGVEYFYTDSNEIEKTCGFTENMIRKGHGLPLRIGYGAVDGREY